MPALAGLGTCRLQAGSQLTSPAKTEPSILQTTHQHRLACMAVWVTSVVACVGAPPHDTPTQTAKRNLTSTLGLTVSRLNLLLIEAFFNRPGVAEAVQQTTLELTY